MLNEKPTLPYLIVRGIELGYRSQTRSGERLEGMEEYSRSDDMQHPSEVEGPNKKRYIARYEGHSSYRNFPRQ